MKHEMLIKLSMGEIFLGHISVVNIMRGEIIMDLRQLGEIKPGDQLHWHELTYRPDHVEDETGEIYFQVWAKLDVIPKIENRP